MTDAINTLPLELKVKFLSYCTEDYEAITLVCKAWQKATEEITYKQSLLSSKGINPDRVDTTLLTSEIRKIIFIIQKMLGPLQAFEPIDPTTLYSVVQDVLFKTPDQTTIDRFLLGLVCLAGNDEAIEKIQQIANFDHLQASTESYAGIMYHIEKAECFVSGKTALWRNLPKGSHDLYVLGQSIMSHMMISPLNRGWHVGEGVYVADCNLDKFDASELTQEEASFLFYMKRREWAFMKKLLSEVPSFCTSANLQLLYDDLLNTSTLRGFHVNNWEEAKALFETYKDKLTTSQISIHKENLNRYDGASIWNLEKFFYEAQEMALTGYTFIAAVIAPVLLLLLTAGCVVKLDDAIDTNSSIKELIGFGIMIAGSALSLLTLWTIVHLRSRLSAYLSPERGTFLSSTSPYRIEFDKEYGTLFKHYHSTYGKAGQAREKCSL